MLRCLLSILSLRLLIVLLNSICGYKVSLFVSLFVLEHIWTLTCHEDGMVIKRKIERLADVAI